jgi:TMEM175 potassium channel family protein
VLYGVNLLLCTLASFVPQICLLRLHGRESLLGRALGRDAKGKGSLALDHDPSP